MKSCSQRSVLGPFFLVACSTAIAGAANVPRETDAAAIAMRHLTVSIPEQAG